MAYFLFGSSLSVLSSIIMGIVFGILEGNIADFFLFLLVGAISALVAFLITKSINKRTPADERFSTWWRAWWLGLRITAKISLCLTLILIPKMISWNLSVSREDESVYEPHWYDKRKDEGKVIYDENGNEYEIGRSGDYVKDGSGNWIKVHRNDRDHEPYYMSGSEKIWLKQTH